MIDNGYVFTGFATEDIDVGGAVLHVRHGGHGPAVLLLHGHPRTGATWHRVAPLLVAAGFAVVCPDLRGIGASIGPEPSADESADKAAGRRLEMPVLALWSLRDDLEELYGDPLAIWRDWATDVRGYGIDSGHHVAEEAPERLAAAIIRFAASSLPG